jgi:hypothetical protein
MSLIENIKKAISTRPTIFLKEPIIKKFMMEIEIHGTRMNAELDRMKEEKKREWLAKYPPGLVDMAIKLAEEWTISMTQTFAAYRDVWDRIPPEAQRSIVKANFEKGLSVGERWLKAMTK